MASAFYVGGSCFDQCGVWFKYRNLIKKKNDYTLFGSKIIVSEWTITYSILIWHRTCQDFEKLALERNSVCAVVKHWRPNSA